MGRVPVECSYAWPGGGPPWGLSHKSAAERQLVLHRHSVWLVWYLVGVEQCARWWGCRPPLTSGWAGGQDTGRKQKQHQEGGTAGGGQTRCTHQQCEEVAVRGVVAGASGVSEHSHVDRAQADGDGWEGLGMRFVTADFLILPLGTLAVHRHLC